MNDVTLRRASWLVLWLHAVAGGAFTFIMLTYTLVKLTGALPITQDLNLFVIACGASQTAFSAFAILVAIRLGYSQTRQIALHCFLMFAVAALSWPTVPPWFSLSVIAFFARLYVIFGAGAALYASCLTLYDATCKLHAREVLQLGCGRTHAVPLKEPKP